MATLLIFAALSQKPTSFNGANLMTDGNLVTTIQLIDDGKKWLKRNL